MYIIIQVKDIQFALQRPTYRSYTKQSYDVLRSQKSQNVYFKYINSMFQTLHFVIKVLRELNNTVLREIHRIIYHIT